MTALIDHHIAFADVNGTRIHYEVAGQGHPLVLVHAGVADLTMWDAPFPILAQHYRVIRYDHRGFGQTAMPPEPYSFVGDLYGLLQVLGVERAYLAGVSIGGSTVLDFTLEHPEMVSALVLVAAGVSGTPPNPADEATFAPMEAAYEARDVDRVLALEDAMWLVGPGRGPEAVAPALHTHFARMERANLEHEFSRAEGKQERPAHPAYDRLGEVHVPTLVVVGDADVPDVVRSAQRLGAEIPGARLVVLPDTAHMVPMERPEEFTRLLLDFLAGVEPGQ